MNEDEGQDPPALTVGNAIGNVRLDAAIVVVGAVALAAGSLGTWASVGALSVSGTDGSDGKITLGAAVVCLIGLGIARYKRAAGALMLLVVGAVGLGVGGYDLIHASHAVGRVTLFGIQVAHIGWGLYAVVVGGAVVLLGAGLMAGHVLRRLIPTVALIAGAGVIVAAAVLQSTSSVVAKPARPVRTASSVSTKPAAAACTDDIIPQSEGQGTWTLNAKGANCTRTEAVFNAWGNSNAQAGSEGGLYSKPNPGPYQIDGWACSVEKVVPDSFDEWRCTQGDGWITFASSY